MSTPPPEELLAKFLTHVHSTQEDQSNRLDHHELEIQRLFEVCSVMAEQLRSLSGLSWEEIFAAQDKACPPELQGGGVFKL